MLTHRNGSNTAIVILHEIYGINQHMKDVCERLSRSGYDVYCPNLVDLNEAYNYDQEAAAYKNFMNVGFQDITDTVKSLLGTLKLGYRALYVVGYSVGATVAWRLSANPGLVDAVVAYYGSRIRDYLDQVPQCPTLLLFPKEEKSFDIQTMIPRLLPIMGVEIHQYQGLHGFTDPRNRNYVERESIRSFADTLSFLDRVGREKGNSVGCRVDSSK
jgi:dienelactone hydrolase